MSKTKKSKMTRDMPSMGVLVSEHIWGLNAAEWLVAIMRPYLNHEM